jgi:predicted nucleic-acid-binding Zn-ribbon protein
MLKPEDGVWYIVVTCQSCLSTIFLFRDLTEGKGNLDATYTVTCPRCGHKGSYTARHLQYSPTS